MRIDSPIVMKTAIYLFFIICMTTVGVRAADFRPFEIGVDVGLPYSLLVDGQDARSRLNLNAGIDTRWWWNDEGNVNLRIDMDMEKKTGSFRRMGVALGVAKYFLSGENFRPYVGLEVPARFRGAPNAAGTKDKMDIGISGRGGFVWRLGDAIGWPGMDFRYDFGVYYFFGAGRAVSELGLDLFRFGIDYRF